MAARQGPHHEAQKSRKLYLSGKVVEDQFVAEHSDYAISLLLKSKELANPFAMTNAEYDAMLAAFANNYDKSRYEDFVKSVNEMKKYLKGSHFKDLAVETIEGKPANLKDILSLIHI